MFFSVIATCSQVYHDVERPLRLICSLYANSVVTAFNLQTENEGLV